MRCLRELCQCSVRYVSVHLTAIERLRGERMCANSGRTMSYGDSAQTMEKKEALIINCSEMRTEGTSRSSAGMFPPPAHTDPKKSSPCNIMPALGFSLMTHL